MVYFPRKYKSRRKSRSQKRSYKKKKRSRVRSKKNNKDGMHSLDFHLLKKQIQNIKKDTNIDRNNKKVKIKSILSNLIFQLKIDYFDELKDIDFSNTNKILLLNQIVMKLGDKKTDDKEVTHKKTITSGIGQVLFESSMI